MMSSHSLNFLFGFRKNLQAALEAFPKTIIFTTRLLRAIRSRQQIPVTVCLSVTEFQYTRLDSTALDPVTV